MPASRFMSMTPDPARLQPSSRLNEIADLTANIARDAARIHQHLGTLNDIGPIDQPNPVGATIQRRPYDATKRDADVIAAYLRARRSRESCFPEGMFADPAWDMLLDLFVAYAQGKRISVSSACIAAAVPSTTALRWMVFMESCALVEREKDCHDHRRVWVEITPKALAGINAWLDCMWPITSRETSSVALGYRGTEMRQAGRMANLD